MAIAPDGRFALVANGSGCSGMEVARVDLHTNAVTFIALPNKMNPTGLAIAPARHDSAEHFSRKKVQHCTAMGWIFIPAYCFAIP